MNVTTACLAVSETLTLRGWGHIYGVNVYSACLSLHMKYEILRFHHAFEPILREGYLSCRYYVPIVSIAQDIHKCCMIEL